MNIQLISVIFLLQFLSKVTSMIDLNMIPLGEDEGEEDQSNQSAVLPSPNEGSHRQMVAGSVEPLIQSQSGLNGFPHASMPAADSFNPQQIVHPSLSMVYNTLATPDSSHRQEPEGIGPIRNANASNGKQNQTRICGEGKNHGKARHRYRPYGLVPSNPRNMQTPTLEKTVISRPALPVLRLPAAVAAKLAGGVRAMPHTIEHTAVKPKHKISKSNHKHQNLILPKLTDDELNAFKSAQHTFRGHKYIQDVSDPRKVNNVWTCNTMGPHCMSQLVIYEGNHFYRTALHTCGGMDTNSDIISGEVCIERNTKKTGYGYNVKFTCKDMQGFVLTVWASRMDKGKGNNCTPYAFDMQYCNRASGESEFYFQVAGYASSSTKINFEVSLAHLIGKNTLNLAVTGI